MLRIVAMSIRESVSFATQMFHGGKSKRQQKATQKAGGKRKQVATQKAGGKPAAAAAATSERTTLVLGINRLGKNISRHTMHMLMRTLALKLPHRVA